MGRINATVRDEHLAQLEKEKERAKENGEDDISDAEATRRIFDRAAHAQELRNQLEEVRSELASKENRLEDLRNQLAATNSRNDDVDDIVEYVQEERDLQQRREERRDAPLWTRARWYVFGRDNNSEKSEA